MSSVSSSFLFSALLELLGLLEDSGIFLASVTGVPPEESFSRVERISLAVEERGAGGETEGAGELCGEEEAVLGREDGGGATLPSDGWREETLSLSRRDCFSTVRLRTAAEYGLAESSRDLRAALPKMIGPP